MNKIENIRHSLAHLLASAVLDKFPTAKLGIGPTIENGFYYDFLLREKLTPEDLKLLENKMRSYIKDRLAFTGRELTPTEAKKLFKNQPFKLELIKEFSEGGEKLTIYKTGNVFMDLCRGGHVKNTKEINPDAFTLTKIAGAYFRGDEKREQLQRIYGLAFETKGELEECLKMIEEAKKRDHKKLGIELDLFFFSDLVGSGLPLWTPKGTLLRDILDSFVWELRKKYSYERVDIPHLAKYELYETSGHWEKFKDELFKITTREGRVFALKPMNCPHHIQIYNRRPWSYREMPQRYASTTKVYRDEQTGELSGLSRVRSITQDDAHVFCRSKEVKNEISKIWEIINEFYKAFGFKLKVRLSLHDPEDFKKYLGTPKMWKESEDKLRQVIIDTKATFEEAVGEAAFYGPKIDFIAHDSLGRKLQVATIQLDMNLPERFDLNCINEEGGSERIVMIHAAIMGSIERYISVLIEHFAGAFPLWLSPIQVIILPISEKFKDYALSVKELLEKENIRVKLDESNETLGKKIRNAEIQKIPYILVVGEKEEKNDSVNIRHYHRGQEGELEIQELTRKLKKEILEKTL